MSVFVLIKEETTSKAIIMRCVEIGSPCLVHLSNLKCGVVLLPLIVSDCGFFTKIFIYFLNLLPN